MKKKRSYKVIGLMSGTSLDGLDIVFCTFSFVRNKWAYKINSAQTIAYSNKWVDCLKNVERLSALQLALVDSEYGHYLGKQVNLFVKKHRIKPDFVASHGHTIFHQPHIGLTKQIGNGAAIAAECGLPAICDFRTKDVAMGGQGAPLVPIGDELLFEKFTFCINLGGFANISFKKNKQRIAYDICPANIVLNELSRKLGKKYDHQGKLATKGKVDVALLKQLNGLAYYQQKAPKSLGKEWVLEKIYPLIKKSGANPFDSLRTFTEHIAIQVAKQCALYKPKAISKKLATSGISTTLLITGGGVYNDFLVSRIKTHCDNATVFVPDKKIIEFKEALIFAFLGVLRIRGEVNSLRSVTGALKNSIGGCVYAEGII